MMGIYLHFSSHSARGFHGIILSCHADGLVVYCLVFVVLTLYCGREQALYEPQF